MGCTSSRSVGVSKAKGQRPLPQRAPLSDSNGHLVALTSSSYGFLSLDSEKNADDAVEADPINQMYRKMMNIDTAGSQLPQSWSEVSDALSILKTEAEQQKVSKSDSSTSAGAPASAWAAGNNAEKIDISELLGNIDEDVAKDVRRRRKSSLQKEDKAVKRELSIHTLEEVDRLSATAKPALSSNNKSEDHSDRRGSSSSSSSSSEDELSAAYSRDKSSNRRDKRFSTSAVVPRSRSSVVEKKSSRSISSGYSVRRQKAGSVLFDPEFLASFQEEFENISKDFTGGRKSSERSKESSSVPAKSQAKASAIPSEFLAGDTAAKPSRVKDAIRVFDVADTTSSKQSSKARGSSNNDVFEVPSSYSASVVPNKLSGTAAAAKQKRTKLPNPLLQFEKLCPLGGAQRVILYTTSLRGVRKTFEECVQLRNVLESFDVDVDERDVSMDSRFRQELKDLVAKPVPRLFIKGRYIGGTEEVLQLHESGTLAKLLQSVPRGKSLSKDCDGCGGVRFIPCTDCNGSRKLVSSAGQVMRCPECNENGLARCPICS